MPKVEKIFKRKTERQNILAAKTNQRWRVPRLEVAGMKVLILCKPVNVHAHDTRLLYLDMCHV